MSNSTNVTAAPLFEEMLFREASKTLPALLSQTSANVLLVWDIIITFEQEVELVWRTRNCVVNFLFLFIRYGGLSQVLVDLVLSLGDFKTEHNICSLYVWYFACSSILVLGCADILLVYRAFAFYARDRRVLVCLLIIWLLNNGTILILGVFVGVEVSIFHLNTSIIRGVIGECQGISFPKLLRFVWISELVFHSILFLLVMGRFIKQTLTLWKQTPSGISAIYLVFIRDGVWTYFLLFGVFIASASQTVFTDLQSVIQWALVCTVFASSRLIFNLRSLHPQHIKSGNCVMSIPNWAGKEVLFDTVSEVVFSRSALLQDDACAVELQNMGQK